MTTAPFRGAHQRPRGLVPAYGYTCDDCGASFEVRMSIAAYSAGEKAACEACGSADVSRTFTSVNVLTTGRGSSGPAPSAGCGRSGFT
jgi:putative FmdB family regulatory protein